MSAPISEDDLHAFADGKLAPTRLAQVEAWLAAHPEHRQQVEDWRVLSAHLHRTYDRVLDEPIPARVLPAANASRWRDPLARSPQARRPCLVDARRRYRLCPAW